MTDAALTINNLRIEVAVGGADIVDEINLSIGAGEVLGLVGESGSGKTTVGLAVLGHARRGVKLAAGEVMIGDASMMALGEVALRHARGKLVSYVPQDPSTALNPALRINKQLIEVLEFHNFGGSDAARQARVIEVMSEVLLPSTPEFLRRYPHQLSGGQQQRVGLAMAFACRPSVIVLDEPTTGLDVSTQAHVLTTIRQLCHAHKVAALYVTHDLAVVATLADHVAVMYAGRIVEQGPAEELFQQSVPSVHPPPDCRRPRHVDRPRDDRSQRPRPGAGSTAGRLLVCQALRAGDRCLSRRVPCRARGRARPSCTLHPAVRGTRANSARVGALVADRGIGNPRVDGARSVRLVHRSSRWSTTSICTSIEASAWRWSASRVPARRPCRGRSVACTASGRARSCSAPSVSRRRRAIAPPRSGCASSTSSRTRTARCNRGA